MSDAQAHDPPPLPLPVLILLGVWAVALLAYPAWFLVAVLRSPSVGIFVQAIPYAIVLGILKAPVVLIALAIWAVAVGAGMAVLRRTGFESLSAGEQAVFGGALGMGILSLGTFVLGKLNGGPRWLLTALLVVLVVGMASAGLRDLVRAGAAAREWLVDWHRRRRVSSIFIILLSAGIVFFALARANVPVVGDYDSLEYHLAAPAQWWQAGRVFFIRDVVYTNMPQNTEMLYLLAMCLCGGPMLGATVGLQVGVGFVVLTAGAIALCGRRLAGEAAGLAGAAIFLTMPMLAEVATLNSYVVEMPLTAYSFLALFAFLLLCRAESGRARRRLAVLCGAMAGLAVGCKYPAVLFVLVPILAFIVAGGILRLETLRRSLGEALLVGAVAVAMASPWLVRNAANTGNPTYPLLYDKFGSSNWTREQDVKFAKAHGPSDVRLMDLWRPFCAYAVWRDQPGEPSKPPWRPPASPVLFLFAIIPLALADRRSAVAILGFAILCMVLAAKQRFWPGEARLDVLLAAGVLALATCPAFLVARGRIAYLALHFVWCLLAWYTLTHRLDRFLDPAAPALAVLAGIGLATVAGRWPRRVANGILVGGLAYTLAITLVIHAGPVWAGLAHPTDEFLEGVFHRSTYCQPAMNAINTTLPPDATVLFVGETRTFYCRRRAIAATVFDRHPIDRIIDAARAASVPADPPTEGDRLLAAAPPPERPRRLPPDIHDRIRDGLRDLGVTHIYVNWPEVDRLNSTYAHRLDGLPRKGFSEHITPQLFAALLSRGHLRPLATFGAGLVPPFAVYELR